MRIGILTFHYAHNYGAVLQAYALQYILERIGHAVCFIDYRNKRIYDGYKVFDINRYINRNPLKCIQNTCAELKTLFKRRKRFESFNRFITNKLKVVPETDVVSKPFDCIIVGSDQVWNTKLTNGFDPYYWGFFQKPVGTRLISYAASMEQNGTEGISEIKRYLGHFDAISVREKELEETLSGILPEKEIATVVDPTVLIQKEVWEELSSPPPIKEPYLLLYQVRNSPICENIAKQIAEEKNLKLIYLSASVLSQNSDECISTSPEEYLGWFRYASFVVCSSFHGTVFSLLFERPFYSIRLNDGKDSRVKNLLNEVNLSNRFISSYHSSENKNETIDFYEAKVHLGKLADASIKILKRYLQL